MHKLTHRGEKLQNPKASQCYNYTSFFLLGKHEGGVLGGSYLAPCSHPPLPHSPAFTTSLAAQIGEPGINFSPEKKKKAVEAQQVLLILLQLEGLGIKVEAGVGGPLPLTERGFVRISGERRSFRRGT